MTRHKSTRRLGVWSETSRPQSARWADFPHRRGAAAGRERRCEGSRDSIVRATAPLRSGPPVVLLHHHMARRLGRAGGFEQKGEEREYHAVSAALRWNAGVTLPGQMGEETLAITLPSFLLPWVLLFSRDIVSERQYSWAGRLVAQPAHITAGAFARPPAPRPSKAPYVHGRQSRRRLPTGLRASKRPLSNPQGALIP